MSPPARPSAGASRSGPGGGASSAPTRNVLLGLTGSVASIKAPELVAKLLEERPGGSPRNDPGDPPLAKLRVKVVLTDAARRFVAPADLPLPPEDVFADEDEWRAWGTVGDPVAHIDLRRWADVFLIAPCSANTLAKLANGLSDTLVTCVFRAWDWKDDGKKILVAPAMNTAMWDSPFTRKHLDVLENWEALNRRIEMIPPVVKRLACGDVGAGAMAPVDEIVDAVRSTLRRMKPSRFEHLELSAATYEPLGPRRLRAAGLAGGRGGGRGAVATMRRSQRGPVAPGGESPRRSDGQFQSASRSLVR